LADILVRVGDNQIITEDLVLKMLSADRKYALFTARMFSMDFDPRFDFMYKFTDENGNLELKEYGLTVNVVMEELKVRPYSFQVSTYGEIEEHRVRSVKLPVCKKEVFWNILDGNCEMAMLKIKRKDLSALTSMKIRNPRYKDENSGVTMPLDLDNLSFKDIEVLRSEMVAIEGDVDTTVILRHPDKDGVEEVADLMSQKAFFFPSQAI
jgi:hypothetical protein